MSEMAAVLGIFILASVFEIRRLVKSKDRKELAIYLAIMACAVSLGVFLMLSSSYSSFVKTLFNMFNRKN